ncbi:MAG: DUF481 domain-containing protein [Planctomycetota bacterium]
MPFPEESFDYTALDGSPTIDNHRFAGRWDLFLSKRWFATPISLDLFRDRFANIALQVTPGAGGGYRVVDTSKVEWELDLAAGWRFTEFESVIPGTPGQESTATIIPGTRLEWDITSDIEFKLSHFVQVGVPDTADTNQHLVMGFEFDLLEDIDLDITFQWDRVGQPRRRRDPSAKGRLPDHHQLRLGVLRPATPADTAGLRPTITRTWNGSTLPSSPFLRAAAPSRGPPRTSPSTPPCSSSWSRARPPRSRRWS